MGRVKGGLGLSSGLLLHIEDIRQLAKAHPKVPIVLDHAAFVKSKSPGSDEWQELLSLATFPQVHPSRPPL